jgi:hypothetical protein
VVSGSEGIEGMNNQVFLAVVFCLAFAGGLGSATLRGRPLPGTLRIASRADLSYKASFVIGTIPALKRRILTVFTGTRRISAISDMVYPSIIILSEYITEKQKNIVGKPQISLRLYSIFVNFFNKSSIKITFYLDLMLFMYYIINMSCLIGSAGGVCMVSQET